MGVGASAHRYDAGVATLRISSAGRRAVRDGLVLAGLLFCGYLFFVTAPQTRTVGFDAYAYWAVEPVNPYADTWGLLGAFRYSPVFVRLFDRAIGLVPQLDPRELERSLSLLGRIPDSTILRLFDLLGSLPDQDVVDLVEALSRLSPTAARRATRLMSGVVRTVGR